MSSVSNVFPRELKARISVKTSRMNERKIGRNKEQSEKKSGMQNRNAG